MKSLGKAFITGFILTFGIFLIHSAIADEDGYTQSSDGGSIVIANRASGTISIIDVTTDTLRKTITLPLAANPSQPMYATHSAKAKRVFVGDRGNNRVVVFDDEDFDIETTIPTGRGVFHMWSDPTDNQLWINNDIDNTVTVIDPVTLEILATVAMPDDLVALGGKPHDVILDPAGNSAFITMIGVSGSSDYVVKIDTDSFTEVARTPVGKDPHVSLTRRNKLLYVPTQNNNAVFILKRGDLSIIKIIDVPGAHGAGMTRRGKTFYTTNISGGGIDGLYAIDTKTNTLIGNPVNTPFPTPHNIAINSRGSKLYVTHSGATSDQVSVYSINKKNRLPVLLTTVTVGLNPFGLAFVR